MAEKNVQMDLTPQKIPAFAQYESGDGADWRVDRWPLLAEKFELKSSDLSNWHLAFAGQGRVWVVLRRLFGVFPLLGAEADDYKQWDADSLSKELGVSKAKLEEDLDAADEYWRKTRKEMEFTEKADRATKVKRLAKDKSAETKTGEGSGKQVKVVVPGREDEDFSGISSLYRNLSDDAVDNVLLSYGFSHVKGSELRLAVADRCLSLVTQFEQANTRAMARQLVNAEISMEGYERILVTLRNRVAELEDEDTVDDATKTEQMRVLAGDMEKFETRMGKISKAYNDLLTEIGADEKDLQEQKREAVNQLGFFTEACRRYHATGDKHLIDGVFTAEEIEWLLKPTKLRDPQYRPDFSALIFEAMKSENLWDPEYKPTPINREVCRKLNLIVKTLEEVNDDEKFAGVDDVSDEVEDEDGISDVADVLDGGVDVEVSGDAPVDKVEPMAWTSRRASNGADCIGMV